MINEDEDLLVRIKELLNKNYDENPLNSREIVEELIKSDKRKPISKTQRIQLLLEFFFLCLRNYI